MEELRQLTAGQKAVVDAYIVNFAPADHFDFDTCTLVDTQTMILDMGTMCNFDEKRCPQRLDSQTYRLK